eukprot:TRINITY_DN4804_c0_g1_i1.p1 TRINITY_DN4804_c0_g1~~TRINITY_DN4804_c0_g1_i1.p1  ORF type:complete len:238 (-),score=55.50 TRINITY_DN4804_c0_g1_i1:19-732(-)
MEDFDLSKEDLQRTIRIIEREYIELEKKYEDVVRKNEELERDNVTLRKTISNMNLLNRDRAELVHQISDAQSEIEKLRESSAEEKQLNESILQENKQLSQHHQQQTQQQKRVMGPEDRKFQEQFNLPNTEYQITYWLCYYGMLGGSLYLSPNYITFSTHILNAEKVVLPIKSITKITKIKTALSFLNVIGSGHSLKFLTNKKEEFVFRGFIKRKAVVNEIDNVSKAIGHKIELVKER